MKDFAYRFDTAVNQFVSVYPELVDAARIALNGLFDQDDYPTTSQLYCKYQFSIEIEPLPDSSDFRCSLTAADEARIKTDIERRQQEKAAEAMRDLWTRLFDVVSNIRERLSAPDAIFRDSLINNAKDICKLLPRLNIGNDQTLENLSKQVEAQLATLDPQILREKPAERKQAAENAASICDLMAAYMGGGN
jgi:hypothetical protein